MRIRSLPLSVVLAMLSLFVVSADSAMEDHVAGKSTGVIRTMRVDVPHAGLP